MQFHDLEAQYQALKAEIDAGMAEVVRGGQFILGPQVALLEERLSEDAGRAYCVTCGNGTDALVLALICSFLPLNITVVFGAILILIHMYALSLEAFAITFVLFALMFLLFFRTAGFFTVGYPCSTCRGEWHCQC